MALAVCHVERIKMLLSYISLNRLYFIKCLINYTNMATKEGSGPKASRSGSSRPPNASADSAIEIDGVDEQERRYPSNQKVSIPAGSPPKMPSDDKLFNWPMVEMRFRIWLRRLPMLNEILSEEIGRNEDKIAAQKIKFGTY